MPTCISRQFSLPPPSPLAQYVHMYPTLQVVTLATVETLISVIRASVVAEHHVQTFDIIS